MNLDRMIGCAAAMLLAGCAVRAPETPGAPGMDAPAGEIAFIPRQRELSPADQRRVEGMSYDPVDVPLAFTPDGDLVVGHAERYVVSDTRWDVCAATGFYRVPRNGGPAQPLVTGRRVCRAVGDGSASADGAWVVYRATPQPIGVSFVRLELATGRADTLRTGSGVALQNPALSPDGRMIAAVGRTHGGDPADYSLYVMNGDGSGLRAIGEGDVNPGTPVWSGDGRRLAYVRERGRGTEVVVMGVDGADARAVGRGSVLAWSPDGEWLAVLQEEVGVIQAVRPDGTGRRVLFSRSPRRPFPVTDPPRTVRHSTWQAVWSPDSRGLAFSRLRDVGTSVWRIEAATRRLRQVTRPDQ